MKRIVKRVATFAVVAGVLYFIGYGIGKMLNTMLREIDYPETAREGVVDNYHGVEVADPYRWLEDDMSERTAEWRVRNFCCSIYKDQTSESLEVFEKARAHGKMGV